MIEKSIINEDNNIEKIINLLKNNKDIVKDLTNSKILPSSYRLYLRSLAGITDPVNESFFKDSELNMMRKKIGRSEISNETGDTNYSLPKNTIGYGYRGGKNLSVLGALTDDETNIDMTIGRANYTKDKEGNYILEDKYDFEGIVGGRSYGKMGEETYRKLSGAETDKDIINAAIESYKKKEIPLAQVARIIGGINLGTDKGFEGVPVKINLGQLTDEDKKESIKLDKGYQENINALKENQTYLNTLNNIEKNPRIMEFAEPNLKSSLDYMGISFQDYKKDIEKGIQDRIMNINNEYGKYSPYSDDNYKGIVTLQDIL
jgi:ribosome recycling factor